MEQVLKKKPFSKRAFISTAMLISGLLLPVSGIMNHDLQFEQLTIERHFWMSVHNVSAIIFLIFSILHISFNGKALLNYLKKTKEIFISKEAILALIFIFVIVGLFASHVFHIN
jgi:succinate dehydrogenase/fumarate reductase cytochrome b subunit